MTLHRLRVEDALACLQSRAPDDACAMLREERFRPCWHQRVPPNDRGIALGQICAAALAQLQETPR